jgi:hypothetical protein
MNRSVRVRSLINTSLQRGTRRTPLLLLSRFNGFITINR